MNYNSLKRLVLTPLLLSCLTTQAQIQSTSTNITAYPKADRVVPFDLQEKGTSLPINWGIDMAWLDDWNIRRTIAYMGAENVDVVRASFQPSRPTVNGDLQKGQIDSLNLRLKYIDLCGPQAKVVLNSDHFAVDPCYPGNPQNWVALIKATAKRVMDHGRTIVTISPFNEPDFGWGQGSQQDFLNIAKSLKQDTFFDGIRISGGNTLNTDKATSWFTYLSNYIDEGNTHQLAGSFDNYANFYQTVRNRGKHATNDELHNVMEAIVGSQYGLQTGIWWGAAEWTRSEFMRASEGQRIGYAEHRPNWTAAAVYRSPEGKVQAFGGTSERQAVTTTYRFLSTDRDVFFDGHGPQREYVMELPGGTGYQQGQCNAEGFVNITWGADIQPIINGRYKIINRKSKKLMEVSGGTLYNGANIAQNKQETNATYQQWNVEPVNQKIGGDYCYFYIKTANNKMSLDLLNNSLKDNANIICYDFVGGHNQQWFLEYAEDGWFYIRSRQSSLCLEVVNGRTTNGANIQQRAKDGSDQQQWRFIPYEVTINNISPAAPTNVTATPMAGAIRLDWTKPTDRDIESYNIYRSDVSGEGYSLIARNVSETSFIDNSAHEDQTYYYCIKTKDKSLNHSKYSEEISAKTSGEKALIASYDFEKALVDSSAHLNHSAIYDNPSYIERTTNNYALRLNGSSSFVQLPTTLPHIKKATIACRVYWRGGYAWQRIFDFGNNQEQYAFLCPRTDDGKLRFAIANGGEEQQLNAPAIGTNTWTHIAVTLDGNNAAMYVNGELVDEADNFTLSLDDIKPILNYIGRSQFDDPLLRANIDEFRIYNYAMDKSQVNRLAQGITDEITSVLTDKDVAIWPSPATDVLNISIAKEFVDAGATIYLYNIKGYVVMQQTANLNNLLNISSLPSGIYNITIDSAKGKIVKKIIVK